MLHTTIASCVYFWSKNFQRLYSFPPNGHLAKSQEYQQDTIFGSWGATAKAADFTDAAVQDATDKNADA